MEISAARSYMEGRSFLIVERTEPFLLSPASAFELNIFTNYFINR
jgi:hypothetical protein